LGHVKVTTIAVTIGIITKVGGMIAPIAMSIATDWIERIHTENFRHIFGLW
jgi:hypothetical protein